MDPSLRAGMAGDPQRPRAFERWGPLVLLVEDDASCRSSIVRTLRGAGFEVCEAADGIDALGLIYRWRIDAIVTDLMMPKLGGVMLVDLAQRIHPELPIVAYTGAASAGDQRRRVLARRGVELLDKPFVPEDLLGALRRALDRVVAPR